VFNINKQRNSNQSFCFRKIGWISDCYWESFCSYLITFFLCCIMRIVLFSISFILGCCIMIMLLFNSYMKLLIILSVLFRVMLSNRRHSLNSTRGRYRRPSSVHLWNIGHDMLWSLSSTISWALFHILNCKEVCI